MLSRPITIRHIDTGETREAEVVEERKDRPTLVYVRLWGPPLIVDSAGTLHVGRRALRWMVVGEGDSATTPEDAFK